MAAALCGAAAFLYIEDPFDQGDGQEVQDNDQNKDQNNNPDNDKNEGPVDSQDEDPDDDCDNDTAQDDEEDQDEEDQDENGSPDEEDDDPESNASGKDNDITYVLYGGTNSILNPAGYDNGMSVSLQAAGHEDLWFYAWYLDPEFKNICNMITPEMTGNITLYAKWIENFEGVGFTLKVTGTNKSGLYTYNISGEETYKYLYYDEEKDEYYMYNSYSLKYTLGIFSQMRSGERTYWPSGSMEWTFGGEELINTIYGEKLCEVWIGTSESGSREVQYIGDGWIPYKMTYVSSVGSDKVDVTYTFKEKFTFVTSDELKVNVYADYGVTVSGTGTYSPGQQVTLTASVSEGKTFDGWYDADGSQLSDEMSYSFEMMVADVTIYAMNRDDPDQIFDTGTDLPLISYLSISISSLTITDADKNEVVYESPLFGYTFDTPGRFVIFIAGTYLGNDVFVYYTVMVNGTTVHVFEWEFNGADYTYTMNIDYSDVIYYRDLYGVNERKTISEPHSITFVTSEDPYILKLAADLKGMAIEKGMSDIQTANFVLAFTQYIEYQLDDVYMGYAEYWKFPLETLFDAGGDCEDTAILFCAIVSAMGYDSALFLLPNHMASGICVTGASGDGFIYKGTSYYFCETTSPGFSVGTNPDKASFNRLTVTVYEISASA